MDALDLLMQDHQLVNQLFQQFEAGGTPEQFQQLFDRLSQALQEHTRLEETVFYPAVGQYPQTATLVEESYKEHAEVKQLLADIQPLDNTTPEWGQKMTRLMHGVQAHVAEEEGELFPRLRQLLDQGQLEALGQQMQTVRAA